MAVKVDTKTEILEQAVLILAKEGAVALSMRDLAQKVHIAPSVLYYHFMNKEQLLDSVFFYCIHSLQAQHTLPQSAKDFSVTLYQRLEFYYDRARYVVAILKYFLAHHDAFTPSENGYIPDRAYQPLTSLIEYGSDQGWITSHNPSTDAKVLLHALNGHILEYYPQLPEATARQELLRNVCDFAVRALRR
jgi:AcrR family transcriptional regulator